MTRPLFVILLLTATVASAQTSPPPAGTPAAAGAKGMTRAAGMPLQDGALPPGSLTVRVVQGTFSGNLSGLDVALEVSGQGVKHAPTGATGRAEFAHLPVGAEVHATVVVNGETLESERFVMPAESGIRVLLVAGGSFVDTATAEAAAAQTPPAINAPPLPPGASLPSGAGAVAAAAGNTAAAGAPATSEAQGAADGSIATFRVVMVMLTLLAFVLVGAQQWSRRKR